MANTKKKEPIQGRFVDLKKVKFVNKPLTSKQVASLKGRKKSK